MAYYQNQKRYNSYKNTKTLNKVDKEKKITEAMERKERSIKEFSKNKEISIAVTSAQRDGLLWCVNHPDWSKEMSDSDRMEWINNTIKDILVNNAEHRNELILLYGETLEQQKQEVVEPVVEEVNEIEI